MRILAVADEEDRSLYDHYNADRWVKAGVELIISCGDLRPGYLDYLVSTFNVPCFYVRGNHDTTYAQSPPGGCTDINERLQVFKGVRFFGLEGSHWYNGGPAQYTERQMRRKTFWANWQFVFSGGVEVIVTHSPPRICPLPEKKCVCINPPKGVELTQVGQTCRVDAERNVWDAADLPHRPFDALRRLILKQQPAFFLHGHTHLGYGARPREFRIGNTRVIDCFHHVVLDV